jgi:hypothetical protein
MRQVAALHVPRLAHRRVESIIFAEGEQAEILLLKVKVKDLQRQLRNERKRTKRAKATRLRDTRCTEDKENVSVGTPEQGGEAERLKRKLAEVEGQLEEWKKRTESLRRKVSRFPSRRNKR